MMYFKKLRSITLLQIVAALLIIGIISIIYYPSLKHLPRSDQLTFLVNTIDSHTIWETFKNSYSYNRTRIIFPWDTALFRPILFLILSLEKGIFGNHFPLIQAVGILLHILVVLLLFIIMNQIRRILKINVDHKKDLLFTILGILFISFFAFNFSFTEIIIWTHLHGYMLFHIFTLLTFILLLKYISIPDTSMSPDPGWSLYSAKAGCRDDVRISVRHSRTPVIPAKAGIYRSTGSSGNPEPSSHKWPILVSIWFLILLGSFTYELGQIYALLVGIFFFILLKKIKLKQAIFLCLSFFAIPIIYQSINFIDMQIHKDLFQSDLTASMIIKQALGFQTVEHSLHTLKYWIVHPFFPSLAKITLGGRVSIRELNLDQIGALTLPSLLVFASWALITFLGLIEFMKKKGERLNYFFMLLLLLYLGYFALIVFGRQNMRPGPTRIPTNTYYLYFPICYSIILTFILSGVVILNDRLTKNIFFRSAKLILLFCVPIIIFSSVLKINGINSGFSDVNPVFAHIVGRIQGFIDRHPNSKISFALDHSYGKAPSMHGVYLTTIFFRKYEDNRNPDYVITLSPREVNFIPAYEYRARYKLKDTDDIAPTLVKVGYPKHIYMFNGKYNEVRSSPN